MCDTTGDETLRPTFTIHATKKLMDRVKQPVRPPIAQPTPQLGNWYATAMFWKPQQVAFVMNERTLLPVFMPLAPASSLIRRFPGHLAAVLDALGIPAEVMAREIGLMVEGSYSKTSSRSLLGSMNDFVRLAGLYRAEGDAGDLHELSVRMARTPCGPLFSSYTSPDRAVSAALRGWDRD